MCHLKLFAMQKFTLLCSLIAVITACGSTKKLEISNIKTVYLERNPVEPTQFGGTIEGKIIAQLKDGEEVDVTNNRNLSFISNDLEKQLGKKYKIVKHPVSFDDNIAFAQYGITEKDETVFYTDSIRLNLRGDLKVDAKALNGTDGIDQRNKSTPLFFRDGNNGEHGTQGTTGQDAGDYTAYIWKEGSAYFIYVQNIQTKLAWRYKSIEPGMISIDVSGGDGGNGGNGGDGGTGKDGKQEGGKFKTPGNGGDAGFGGDGANGGRAGSVICFLHSNAAGLELKISFNVSGGAGGQAGTKGKPGQPGKSIEGQAAGLVGRNGRNGRPGRRGIDGQMPQIAIQEFDFSGYKE